MQRLQGFEDANIPLFLFKVWKIVSDPNTDDVISWRECGNTFIIHNQGQFWYDLLPLYFKHNNMSSFVRQLNYYGFHKVSSLDNSGSSEKDDGKSIQFHHPYFQRDAPELLKKIRRKPPKSNEAQSVIGSDELNDALKEVRYLRGRQSSVDSQLSAMKQENSVLWRELALLRQKHVKQQLIVNKLIQFLSTLVRPSTSQRIGVVKQRMPLMLNESSAKKRRLCRNSQSTNDGETTIHDLDSVAELSPDQLIEEGAMEDDIPVIDSPGSETLSVASNVESSKPETTFWDKPDVVTIEDAIQLAENEEDINILQENAGTEKELFLNTNSNRDTLGSLRSPGMSDINCSGGKNITNAKINLSTSQISAPCCKPDIQAKTKKQTLNGGNLNLHSDNTQCELNELKDIILDGCRTFDSNTLFGLFNGNAPGPEVGTVLQNNSMIEKANPMVSGIEHAPTNNLLDFNELLDEDIDSQHLATLSDDSSLDASSASNIQSSSLDTPSISKIEPKFPIA